MTLEHTGSTRTTYTFGMDNMTTEANTGGLRYTSTYSADGLRRSVKSPSKTTTFVWDGSDYLQERS